MDKEKFMQHQTPQEVIDARPQEKTEQELYWYRYETVAEQLFFTGKINVDQFQKRGFNMTLREGMEPENLVHAINLGWAQGNHSTEGEMDAMAHHIEKVIEFVPTEQIPQDDK